MKNEIIQWLSTGQNGVIRLDIPILTFGSNSPRLVITNSVHGDEHVGLAVISKLVDILRVKSLTGTVSFVLAANPAAQFVRARVSPQDFKDLNRVGSGRKDGYYTDRLGSKLFDFFKSYDFVVNIHEFEMHTPITAVFLNAGKDEIKKKILAGIKAFSPEIVWAVKNSKESDIQYQTTLDAALANAGIPSFIVETVQLPFITDNEIDKVVNGFLKLMSHLGILQNVKTEEQEESFRYYHRHEITSDIAGYWEPNQINILQNVKKGDLIGEIRALPDLESEPIFSPLSGTLIQIRHRQLVGTGTSLFSIGIPIESAKLK